MSVVKTINVGYLARVEGEGGLHVKIKGDEVSDVRLDIFEPPRFFEAFMRGRHFAEAPDITARICGICPVAYQMSSIHAMEYAYGVKVEGQLRELRRLLYCGEWIESHALHVYMLHAPDFLGYPDAIKMAEKYPEVVTRGLKMKKIGNELMTLVGGREIHPINVKVGGFYRVPTMKEMREFEEKLEWGRQASLDTVHWVAGFYFPDFERDYEFVALRHPDEYAINEGRIVSSKGLDIDVTEYEQHFREEHVAHSTSLHSTLHGHSYFTGPLARYNLNFDKLPAFIQAAAREVGLSETCNNPFKSIIIRSLELVYAFDEALRIVKQYKVPSEPAIQVGPQNGHLSGNGLADSFRHNGHVEQNGNGNAAAELEELGPLGTAARPGYGCTEAPRGILYHRYDLDEEGLITDAKIVPPTSQNLKAMEDDLRFFVTDRIALPQDQLTLQCEQAVRNYDPCISCSCHYLRLNVEREE